MKKVCSLLFFTCLVSCGLGIGQTFNLQTGREPVTSLEGLWRFHIGDNPAWASPDFDDSQWPLLRSDKSWVAQGYQGYSGYAWYRFTLQTAAEDTPISLLLAPIRTSYQVYANGKLIGGSGPMPPKRLAYRSRFQIYDLPRARGTGMRTLHVAIRVWQFPDWAAYAPGGIEAPGSVAGDTLLLHGQMRIREAAFRSSFANTYTYSVVVLLFGMVVLGLFLFRPAELEYLWFALLLLASATDAVNATALTLSLIPVQIYDIVDGILFAIFLIAGLMFFARVLNRRRDFWWWFACAAVAIEPFTPFSYILNLTSVGVSGLLGVLVLLPAELWILAVLIRSAAQKDFDARLLLFPVLLVYGFSVANNAILLSYQLGWQSKTESLNVPLLRFPFPLYLQDVLFTVFAFTMMLFLVRRFSLARGEEERLSTEFAAARSIQLLLIPATAPSTPGFTVESVYVPATEVGGDFFQVLPGDNDSLLVVVGDVSGKGLTAAMTVSTIVGSLRSFPLRTPAEVLVNLNRVLYGQIHGFVTCCAALISGDGMVTIANAGHLSPYRNGEELAVESGLPLGILSEGSYEELRCRLAPGDRLTLVSDGVVEARDKTGQLFGFERTQQLGHETAGVIAHAAKQFGQEDDITVVTITRALASGASH